MTAWTLSTRSASGPSAPAAVAPAGQEAMMPTTVPPEAVAGLSATERISSGIGLTTLLSFDHPPRLLPLHCDRHSFLLTNNDDGGPWGCRRGNKNPGSTTLCYVMPRGNIVH